MSFEQNTLLKQQINLDIWTNHCDQLIKRSHFADISLDKSAISCVKMGFQSQFSHYYIIIIPRSI
jgi:hypothetical protein